MHFKALYLHSTIPVFCHYFPNTQMILGHKNLTKYQIEYHYYVRNSSNTALGYLAHLKTLFIWRPGSLDAKMSILTVLKNQVFVGAWCIWIVTWVLVSSEFFRVFLEVWLRLTMDQDPKLTIVKCRAPIVVLKFAVCVDYCISWV